MKCRNCYIPNREIPDMDAGWLYGILERLPRRTRIRIAGAEPTVRRDLPSLVSGIRRRGHLPVLLTNGLRLTNRTLLASLKAAGLRTVHLSCNGGTSDALYEAIDEMRCARKKLVALGNLVSERMFITVGMILVRGVNESEVRPFWDHLRALGGVREVHFRSVGSMGRYMKVEPLSLREMVGLIRRALGAGAAPAAGLIEEDSNNHDFMHGGVRINVTQWPDLGSAWRGRLTPDGFVEPCFEHLILNAAQGGY